MSKTLKRTLYVGIGGTGAEALLKIKKCFIDSYGEIPPMIAFLAIDTDRGATKKNTTDSHGRPVRLDKNELLVCTVQGALSVYNKNQQEFDWVPADNVGKLQSIAGNGAGQVRSNGRFIALYNAQKIQTAIQSCVAQINAPIPLGSPYRVELIDGIPSSTIINTFCSIAGGTGSGMIVDVLCMINEAMEQSGNTYFLYPWIVLPDVFKNISAGPAMSNIYYNAYGALKTLDFMQHLNPKTAQPVDFGYTTKNTPLFNYALLINNANNLGTFNVDELINIMAVSAFLPSGDMGDGITSPFDNVITPQTGGIYDIRGKRAWAASIGSAELIYDSMAVARTYTHRLIDLLCTDMINSMSTGMAEANAFVDSPNVLIREDNGRDDVIDSILPPAPDFTITIDKNTRSADIDRYVNTQTGQDIQLTMQANYNKKLSNTKTQLDKAIDGLLDNPVGGNVARAKRFLETLKEINQTGCGQLINEEQAFRRHTAHVPDWDNALKGITGGLFKSVRTSARNALETQITGYVTNIREAERRRKAIAFFNELNSYIDDKVKDLNLLSANIEKIAAHHRNAVITEQNEADSASKIQIYLHSDDVKNLEVSLSDTAKTLLYNELKLSTIVGSSLETLDKKLWSIVQQDSQVTAAAGKTINSVLMSMPQAKVMDYINHVKYMAYPLWKYDIHGFKTEAPVLDQFMIVGVDDRNNILCKDTEYKGKFDTTSHKGTYVSTFRRDRISVLIVEALVPVFAVNNFMTYKDDSDQKTTDGYPLANYINEQWESRMNSEDFSVMPQVATNNIIQIWAYGFIFGFIHFDADANTYWITSKTLGDPLVNYRYNLSSQRDISYSTFKAMKLYNEIQHELNNIITNKGNEYFAGIVQNVKGNNLYLPQYAQLSPTETAQLRTKPFETVANLVRAEIQSL